MAIESDEEVFNDCGDQGDWTGGTLGDSSGFDPPTNNATGSDVELYREGTTAQQWVMKENQTAGYTYTNQVNNGASGARDITGGRIVIFWRWMAGDADLDKVTLHRLRLSSDTGFTTNNAEWNINAAIYALDLYGWFPVAVYPTNPDATTGTIVYTSIDSIGWVATTGGTGTKVTGFDQCHSISYLGGNSASFTYEDLYDNSVTNDLGAVYKFGEFYKFQVNINVGLAGQTANSILNQADKTVYFDNVEPEHELGYVIVNGTSNESHLILGSIVHTWNSQPSTAEIWTNTTDADQFKIDGNTYINGGKISSPADSANRWIRGTKFDNCQAGTISDGEFTDNTVANGEAVTVSGDADLTGTQITTPVVAADASGLVWNGNFDPDGNLDNMVFSKGTNAHHAIAFGTATPTTMTLRSIDFSGFNATDAQNDSTLHVLRTSGSVTINLIGCTGNISYKSAGADVTLVVSPVATSVKILDGRDNSNLQNAMVILEASDGTGDLPYLDSVTITQLLGTATVTHTAHGLVTGNKVIIAGVTNDVDYNGVKTITVTGANAYTYSTNDGPTPATGTITSTGVVLQGLTDVSGEISDTRSWSLAQPVIGVARKASSSPYFKDGNLTGTISTTLGLSIVQALTIDE